MNLPPEKVFEILISLPYESVVSYCQTSTVASQICQTEWFWDDRARRDFDLPLNLVRGGSPAYRYRLLANILKSDQPWTEAIRRNQPDLVRVLPDRLFATGRTIS